MSTRFCTAGALSAHVMKSAALSVAILGFATLSIAPAFSAPKDIRWGSGPVGTSGHKALVVLSDLLHKEMPEIRISALPYPGGVGTVKSFATGELDGYYGSDVALIELQNDAERFQGFRSKVQVMPVQSLWVYTFDVGLGVKSSDANSIKNWNDLAGKDVFTGPLPFDIRKQLENSLKAIGVKHNYKAVDMQTAGSQLDAGRIKAMFIYAVGGGAAPPWLAEATLAVDWVPLSPSSEEVAKLNAKKFSTVSVPTTIFHKKDTSGKNVTLISSYWGFHLGLHLTEAEMYKMLTIIEKNADLLAKLDPSYRQISNGKMAEFQKMALESTADLAPIHPGLAKFLKERNMWKPEWDTHIAKAKL